MPPTPWVWCLPCDGPIHHRATRPGPRREAAVAPTCRIRWQRPMRNRNEARTFWVWIMYLYTVSQAPSHVHPSDFAEQPGLPELVMAESSFAWLQTGSMRMSPPPMSLDANVGGRIKQALRPSRPRRAHGATPWLGPSCRPTRGSRLRVRWQSRFVCPVGLQVGASRACACGS